MWDVICSSSLGVGELGVSPVGMWDVICSSSLDVCELGH